MHGNIEETERRDKRKMEADAVAIYTRLDRGSRDTPNTPLILKNNGVRNYNRRSSKILIFKKRETNIDKSTTLNKGRSAPHHHMTAKQQRILSN